MFERIGSRSVKDMFSKSVKPSALKERRIAFSSSLEM